MKEFKNPESDMVLISMVKIVGTGLDVPSLDILINMSANKSNSDTIQLLGRAKRKYEGKTMGYYISFMDKGMFAGAAREQMLILKKYDEFIGILEHGEILK